MPASSALCRCGCGQVTPIATLNDARHGHVKGHPKPYLRGHAKRKARMLHSSGYVLVWSTEHPRAIAGKVMEHVLIAERALGRLLPAGVVVHHIDHDRANNAPANLVILQSQGEHMELHRKEGVRRAGGNPWTDHWCGGCRQVKASAEFYDRPMPSGAITKSSICKACQVARAMARQRRGRLERTA